MALTMKSISKTGKGRLTIHFINGHKSTYTVWCSRSEIGHKRNELRWINGQDCKEHKILWNGQILN